MKERPFPHDLYDDIPISVNTILPKDVRKIIPPIDFNEVKEETGIDLLDHQNPSEDESLKEMIVKQDS